MAQLNVNLDFTIDSLSIDGVNYKIFVSESDKTATIEQCTPSNSSLDSLSIPESIEYLGEKYLITEIEMFLIPIECVSSLLSTRNGRLKI